jgi:SAM-dependent methyltransferase
MKVDYVHGYAGSEHQRLSDQSIILADLLHCDTVYEPGARVLEAGCGIGAQTLIVAARNPYAQFTCIDIDQVSLETASSAVSRAGLTNVTFEQADLREYRAGALAYDHALLCFVLEHVAGPERALSHISSLVRPGGTITAIEGDHGSTFFYPPSKRAWRTIQCLIDLQARCGGDALIGRRLYPLFVAAGLSEVHVTPRAVYADLSRPDWIEWFTERTYIAMVQGARERALAEGLISATDWDAGIADLRQSTSGTFSYTFFKAIGTVGTPQAALPGA